MYFTFSESEEWTKLVLFFQLSIDMLLTKLIEVFVRKGFGSIEALLGRVNHELGDEVEEESIRFGENLN